MNAYRRSLLLVGILVSMSLFLVSCGDDDNGMEPPPPPPDPGLGWENPTPTGDAMRGIWGSASNNVYAVGNAGTLMRYNGTSWSLASQRLGEDVMWDVWGNTDTDIWAVGDNGAIWHYDGSWSESNSGTDKRLRGVFGLNANNVYAVGDDGTIVQWNGSGWLPVTQSVTTANTNLIAIFALSTTEIWIVTDDPVNPLITFNGSWRNVVMPAMNAKDVWATSSQDIYLVGAVGTIAHRGTGGWTFSSPGGTQTLFSVFGFSSSSIFAVGTGSTVLSFDGANWATSPTGGDFDLYSVWGVNSGDVHALGDDGAVFHRSGVSPWVDRSTTATTTTMRGMTASGSSRFAAGEDGWILSKFGSGAWTMMTTNTTANLNSIHAVSATSVYAVGVGGEIQHYDGSAWSPMTSNTADDLTGVFGTTDTTVVAVGPAQPIMFDGTSWVLMGTTSDASDLLAVWGAASDDMVAVGKNGLIMLWNGTAWIAQASPVSSTLRAVTGTATDDIYMPGDNGVVLYWDGSMITDVMGGQFQVDLYAAAISPSYGVYVIGDLGAICHLVGSGTTALSASSAAYGAAWVELPFTNQSQRAATVDGNGEVYMAGQGGTIIRWGQ